MLYLRLIFNLHKMRKIIPVILFICSAISILSCGQEKQTEVKSYNRGINIIPAPANLTREEGHFTLKKNTSFFISDPTLKPIVEFFSNRLQKSTGYSLNTTSKENQNTIRLYMDPAAEIPEEGYILEVRPDYVTIRSRTGQGIFYGMQSFMQLFPAEIESPELVSNIPWEAPSVSITDYPRFGYRAIMIDPCRHFMTVDELKKTLDVVALFKINTLHWHLSDDQGWRIEIKQYPALTEVGAKRMEGEGFEYGPYYYTQEEIREIVQYAADRFITVIPEIELPGHALAAIAAYPELSCKGEPITPRIIWGVEDIVFCAGKETTFEFLENVFKEIIELFPSEYIHIGGDECPKTEWKQCPHCQARIREQGLKSGEGHTAEEYLQSYFVQRMEKVLAGYGKKIIGFDEILEGGLAPTATVMSWRGEEGGIAAANMGHDAIMVPQNDGMYLDRFEGDPKIEPVTIGGYATLETVYSYDPIPSVLAGTDKEKHILGVQCNTWSEYMYHNDLRELRTFPRIIALAEIGWTTLENKDYQDFERRIYNALVRLDGHGINYHIPQPEQPNGSCSRIVFTDHTEAVFKTSRPMKMVYTLNGQDPDINSEEYTGPLHISEDTQLRIASVLPSGKMGPVRKIDYVKKPLNAATELPVTKAGLKMEIIDGMYLNVEELSKNVTPPGETVLRNLREITQVVKTDESMRGVNQYAAIASGYLYIPEDGVYFISSDNEEVWIDGELLINNRDEVKRFSRRDNSVALAKGLHGIKVVFLGHIIGGWPSNWNDGSIKIRKDDHDQFTPVTPEMLFY